MGSKGEPTSPLVAVQEANIPGSGLQGAAMRPLLDGFQGRAKSPLIDGGLGESEISPYIIP
ncbi:MAG: hypothetical protein OQK82_07725 [Candidatus Pacearchaeota archaeon]|nr:hypothetical protein [Candidatus Pacearchaeota archaeon]